MGNNKNYFDLPKWDATTFINGESKRLLERVLENGWLYPAPSVVDEVHQYLMQRYDHADDFDWYLAATILQGRFVTGLIPPREYTGRLYPALNRGLGKMTVARSFTNRLLQTKQSLDVGYIIDGVLYDRGYRYSSFDKLAAEVGGEGFIWVKEDGQRGHEAAYLVTVDEFSESLHYSSTNWVIQRCHQPAASLSEIGGGRQVTVRLITVRDAYGRFESPSASVIINTDTVEADDHVEVLITDQSGQLDALGFDAQRRTHFSAGNGAPLFSEVKIEHFATARNFALDLHRSLPHFDILSFDLTIDENGMPWLIEWCGDHVDISLSQLRGGVELTGLRYFTGREVEPQPGGSDDDFGVDWEDHSGDGPGIVDFS